jgi:hypothetical protein
VCNFASYEPRNESGGGGWFRRPTFQGLFGLLSRAEAERLVAGDAALAARLHHGSLHPDAPQEAFAHHASCLHSLVAGLGQLGFEEKYRLLEEMYMAAIADWTLAASTGPTTLMADAWVSPLLAGLRRYGAAEGWE